LGKVLAVGKPGLARDVFAKEKGVQAARETLQTSNMVMRTR